MDRQNDMLIFVICDENEKYNKTTYIEITNELLNKKIGKRIINGNYFKNIDGVKYFVDNKNVILDYSEDELIIAKWLIDTFGGTVIMIPRVNNPDFIKTPDYIWNDEKWDLKTITSSSKQALYHSVCKANKQSNNFILDLSKSQLNYKSIKDQIYKIYKRPDTNFINMIIIKKKNKYSIYKRK